MKNNTLHIGLILSFSLFTSSIFSTNFYFDAGQKSSKQKGTKQQPYTNLEQIAKLQFLPGDSILLADGAVFAGSLQLKNTSGSASQPIVVSTYRKSKNAKSTGFATIDAKGLPSAFYAENVSYLTVKNLKLTANAGGMVEQTIDITEKMRCGVLIKVTKAGKYGHIVLNNLHVSDVFFEEPGFVRDAKEVRTANGTQHYGWGIRFMNNMADAELSELEVRNCLIENVEHTGIKITARKSGIKNIKVISNKVVRSGGPGIQLSGVENGLFSYNTVESSGSNDDSRKWGRGSGLWTWGCSNVIIEHNQFLNANGPGDSAGAHIDYNCNDIILQYNLSVNNAGGFCEILGNNYNCAYRYNISVNDGYRMKGQNGAFQEGKTFWLSGYIGKNKPQGPFNSYFYNNTIYVKKEIAAKFAVAKSTRGVCIVNNIFVIEGESREVEGDQFVADRKAIVEIPNVLFENNLYLRENNWPNSVLIQDKSPMIGNPEFANAGGLNLNDYIPKNVGLIKDKGIAIPQLPGDSIGLKVGLVIVKDILGNPIMNNPDLGAIEIVQ